MHLALVVEKLRERRRGGVSADVREIRLISADLVRVRDVIQKDSVGIE